MPKEQVTDGMIIEAYNKGHVNTLKVYQESLESTLRLPHGYATKLILKSQLGVIKKLIKELE